MSFPLQYDDIANHFYFSSIVIDSHQFLNSQKMQEEIIKAFGQ